MTNFRARDFKQFPRTGYPPSFRRSPALKLDPVKGGRWMVRKYTHTTKKTWRAWCVGKASKYNHGFHTHRAAMAWADYVSRCFAIGVEPTTSYAEFSRRLDTH